MHRSASAQSDTKGHHDLGGLRVVVPKNWTPSPEVGQAMLDVVLAVRDRRRNRIAS